MPLDCDACYRAVGARDARFDGLFFTAVKSTGIFCRPVCPARTPRREVCEFFPSAAAALQAGFRPCLRCRPEVSPDLPAWHGTATTVSRALRMINEGALDDGRSEDLAGRVGVSGRHLRRLFVEHLGAAPAAVAQTRRVLFAKKLLTETRLPMAEVAFAAGFTSVRRFNEAVRKVFRAAPGELRRHGSTSAGLTLQLHYQPPYNWRALVEFLAPRALPGIESVTAARYQRRIEVNGQPGLVEVRPAGGYLEARLELPAFAPLGGIVERLRRLFDTAARPREVAAHLEQDVRLGPLVRGREGLRVPGAWDGYELAVRAVLGQQISVKAATTLAGRLAAGGPSFPSADRVAEMDMTGVGITRARALTLRRLSEEVAAGRLRLSPSCDPDETVARLREVPGIGAWTAQYIAMRALGVPDAYPAADLVLRRFAPDDYAERWRPWRAYAAMYIWTSAGENMDLESAVRNGGTRISQPGEITDATSSR